MKKLLSLITLVVLLINSFLPYVVLSTVFAQEATPSASPEVSSSPSPTPTPEPSDSPEPTPGPSSFPSASPASSSTPSPTPIATPSPSPAPSPTQSDWISSSGDNYETSSEVVTGKEYVAPTNDNVKIKFSSISGSSGKLLYKKHRLSAEQMLSLNTVSEWAYEFTAQMQNGFFYYDLTLPLPDAGYEIKWAQSLDQLADARTVNNPKEANPDNQTVTIHGLDHLTVFILTSPAPDINVSALINEILPNPVSGNEWVELYNNSNEVIDLSAGSGWLIRNSLGDSSSLSSLGTIPARGQKVFEHIPGWLSDSGPETVSILNQNGVVVDTVIISTTPPGIEVGHYPAAGESVGRLPDASANWVIFTSPTKGGANSTSNLKAVSPGRSAANGLFPDWYQDDNGVKVVPCLNGADPKCALAAETGFNPASPTVLPGNFPSELFYWSAEALMDTPGGGARLVLANEGAFFNENPAPGDQMVFGRIRIRADGLSPNSDYTVTYPYGSVVIRTDATGNLRSDNDDIGCEVAPCDFAAALQSPVFQSFLRWDFGAPAGYLGDGITEHTVTGSPTGNNFFKIEGPGLPAGGLQTNLFVVLGKLHSEPITPPPGCVDSAPDTPVLTAPADGANGVAISPTLTWNSVASFGTNCLGNNNQFEIFLDPGNVDPTTSFGTVSEVTLSKLVIGLAPNSTFSWKVRAKNGALFTDSAVRTFTTTLAVGGRAVSPNFDADNGYPAWYRDDNGIMIAPCVDGTDPRCVLPGFGEEPDIWNPNLPTDFPDNPGDAVFNFPSEFFYWIAESDFLTTDPDDLDGDGNNGRTGIRFAVEGAFLNELPASGDQMVFGRIRVTGNELQPNSIYTVTHPYGVDTYQTNDLGIITRGVGTEDIGCVASLCDYSIALGSRVFGAFLRHTSAPEGYLGDAISLNPIVGSPLGQNFFRIEGPGLPPGGLETPLFTVSGKVLLAPPPPPEGCVDSAPDQPVLVNPANGATEVSTNPLLTWNAIASFGTNCAGGRNQFEIFLNEGNVDPTTSKGTVLGTQTEFTALNLLPNTMYSWKLRASNGVLSADSVVRTFTTTASTANKAVSATTDPDNGFPDWYRDDLGVSVVPCLDGADPNCVLPGPEEEPGFDPGQPAVLPGNFPSEFFYQIAESDPLATPGGGDVNIRYAVEGAFLNADPAVGDQMVFGRIRVRATGLLPNETYTATHAYGVDTYNTDANGNISSVLGTEDIGCMAGPCNFAEALNSRVFGGFLRMVAGAPVGYLGDGATVGEVTGSPLGQNFFRIEGPGLPEGGLQTNLFTVSGKLLSEAPPPPSGGGDTTAPVITRLGVSPVSVTVGSPYVDAGATALDNVDGNITANIVTTNPVNTAVTGTYTVTYNVSDAAGNAAAPVTRTVNVVEAGVPPPPSTTGTITVVKNTVPNDGQDFGFRLRNGAFDENFSLDDDSDPALSNTRLFAVLAPGTYSLQENGVSNWVLVSLVCQDADNGTTVDLNARSAAIDLDAGESITCTFTNSLRASISGVKFNDVNGNGIKEAGEPGLAGWTIYLDGNDNGLLDTGETSVITDTNGNFSLTDLPALIYNVREVLQPGWEQTLPSFGKYIVDLSGIQAASVNFGNVHIYGVLGQGKFIASSGNSGSTYSVVSRGRSTIRISGNGGESSIDIPDGTVITRIDGGIFDAEALLSSVPSAGTISGLASGVVVDGVLQWGIPNMGLLFSSPITLNIFVGTALNGQTLNVTRSITGISDWTSDGIVAPATCIVSAGLCSFQATKASYYIASHNNPAPTPTPTPGGGSGGSGGGSGSGGGGGSAAAPVCNDAPAGGAPTLISAMATGPNQVTLNWSKAADPVTHYVITYGLTAGSPLYGNPNVGGKDTISYTVRDLSGNTTYFFRVRAGNGCNAGPYSNELAATPGGEVVAGPASGFESGVLGASETAGTNGNVGIGLKNDQDSGKLVLGANVSFMEYLTEQRLLLSILIIASLALVFNLAYPRLRPGNHKKLRYRYQ